MSAFVPIKQAEVSSGRKVGLGGRVLVSDTVFSGQTKRPLWQGRPWRTRAIWSERFQRWEAMVNPGYVNAIDPTALGYLAADTKGKAAAVDLADSPRLPVFSWRDIDGTTEPIPAYFGRRGVRKDRGFSIEGEKVVIDTTPEDPSLPPRRYLKAADVWVSVARAAYSLQTTIQGNFFTGQLVDYTVGYNSRTLERLGARARLEIGAQFPQRQRPTLTDRLNGAYEDDAQDRQIISTIFLLSPPLQPEAELSEWRPSVQHHCGWNLHHTAKNDPPINLPTPQGDPFLKFFVGRYTIVPQATQGAIDAETQRLLAALFNSSSNEGKFWTV